MTKNEAAEVLQNALLGGGMLYTVTGDYKGKRVYVNASTIVENLHTNGEFDFSMLQEIITTSGEIIPNAKLEDVYIDDTRGWW